MTRVTSSEVKGLIKTSFDVDPFIATSNLLVDESLVGQGLSDARLTQIELWLAAHFTAVAEERGALLASDKGDSEEEYGLKVGEGLNMTRFGQQALLLDTTGILADIGSSTSVKKAQFRVV